MCEYVVRTYISTVFPDNRLCGRDKEIVIRFLKCRLFGMCIDWIERGMTDAAYDDLHRMPAMLHDVSEPVLNKTSLCWRTEKKEKPRESLAPSEHA